MLGIASTALVSAIRTIGNIGERVIGRVCVSLVEMSWGKAGSPVPSVVYLVISAVKRRRLSGTGVIIFATEAQSMAAVVKRKCRISYIVSLIKVTRSRAIVYVIMSSIWRRGPLWTAIFAASIDVGSKLGHCDSQDDNQSGQRDGLRRTHLRIITQKKEQFIRILSQ